MQRHQAVGLLLVSIESVFSSKNLALKSCCPEHVAQKLYAFHRFLLIKDTASCGWPEDIYFSTSVLITYGGRKYARRINYCLTPYHTSLSMPPATIGAREPIPDDVEMKVAHLQVVS